VTCRSLPHTSTSPCFQLDLWEIQRVWTRLQRRRRCVSQHDYPGQPVCVWGYERAMDQGHARTKSTQAYDKYNSSSSINRDSSRTLKRRGLGPSVR